MDIRTLALFLALAVAAPATAQITTIQLASEVPLKAVRLPATASGTLTFRSCDECPAKTVRVTAATRWLVNHAEVSLADFRRFVEARADGEAHYVTVRHHLEKDLITRVSIVVR